MCQRIKNICEINYEISVEISKLDMGLSQIVSAIKI